MPFCFSSDDSSLDFWARKNTKNRRFHKKCTILKKNESPQENQLIGKYDFRTFLEKVTIFKYCDIFSKPPQ